MTYVLPALGIGLLVLFGLGAFLRASPALLARALRWIGGGVLGVAGLLLAARGQLHLAIVLWTLAATVAMGGAGALFGAARKTGGQTSQVRTDTLEMVLDHDSGAMAGRVLAGRFKGRELSGMEREELLALLADCQADDAQSVPLLEAYLERAHPDWREAADAGAGRTLGAGGAPMTAAEACQVLGVGKNASPDEIRAAWREQMKRNHPDQGGSTYLAAKINEAKAVLLGKAA